RGRYGFALLAGAQPGICCSLEANHQGLRGQAHHEQQGKGSQPLRETARRAGTDLEEGGRRGLAEAKGSPGTRRAGEETARGCYRGRQEEQDRSHPSGVGRSDARELVLAITSGRPGESSETNDRGGATVGLDRARSLYRRCLPPRGQRYL